MKLFFATMAMLFFAAALICGAVVVINAF